MGDASPAELLAQELGRLLAKHKDITVFIPKFTERDGRHEKEMMLFPGYVFVGFTGDKPKLPSLSGHRFFEPPVSFGKRLGYVSDLEVSRMKRKLKGLKNHTLLVGKRVRIDDGIYKDLEGEVVDTEKEKVVIEVKLVSKDIMVSMSPNFLTMVD